MLIFNTIINWLFRSNKDDWINGYPPPNIPKSYIEEGMTADPDDPTKVISRWRRNAAYYQNLL